MNFASEDETLAKQQPRRERFRRANRIREVILDVALDCFSLGGFNGTSTRSIAKLAGVQHSLVNYHFENKDKLWIAAMDRVLEQFTKQLDEQMGDANKLSASDRLRIFIELYAKTAATSPQMFRIMTQQSTQNSERLNWLLDNHLRDQFNTVTRLVSDAQAEGEVIDGAPEHIFYLIAGAVGTFFASTQGYVKLTGREPSSAAEMHRLIAFLCSIIFRSK